MEWLNEPARWSNRQGELTVVADAGTDFWRTTHYGYVKDNGHLYGQCVEAGFDLRVRVRGSYSSQYDQAGAMVRIDESNWIKTGVEYFDGRLRLSTVVTYGSSSWFVAELPGDASSALVLSLARSNDCVEIRYGLGEDPAELAAICFLRPDKAVTAGVMCAAPEGPGFEVSFSDLDLRPL